jgi:AcrR family transcriptional regulator
LAVARQLYDDGEHTLEAIAATIEVSRSTLYRHLATRTVTDAVAAGP